MVKFGISKTPQKRLMDLQVGSPVRLELFASIKGTRELEKKIHQSLRHLRSHGEWFKYEHEAIEIATLISCGNSQVVYDRLAEIYRQLEQCMVSDYPDKNYWGNREEMGTTEHMLATLISKLN